MTDRLAEDRRGPSPADGLRLCAPRPEMRNVLQPAGLRELGFVRAQLGTISVVDAFMADGGALSAGRRFAAFPRRPVPRSPRKPQSAALPEGRDYNPLKWRHRALVRGRFAEAIGAGASRECRRSLATCKQLFDRLTPAAVRPDSWHVRNPPVPHRRATGGGQEGPAEPPEGMHPRSGVDWVLVLLVKPGQCPEAGETSIHDPAKATRSAAFTLTESLDAALHRRQPGCFTASPRVNAARPGAARPPRTSSLVTFRPRIGRKSVRNISSHVTARLSDKP